MKRKRNAKGTMRKTEMYSYLPCREESCPGQIQEGTICQFEGAAALDGRDTV